MGSKGCAKLVCIQKESIDLVTLKEEFLPHPLILDSILIT